MPTFRTRRQLGLSLRLSTHGQRRRSASQPLKVGVGMIQYHIDLPVQLRSRRPGPGPGASGVDWIFCAAKVRPAETPLFPS